MPGDWAVRTGTVADATVLAGLLHDFDTEFDGTPDPVEVLAGRFARLADDDAALALLVVDGSAADGAGEPVGFALVTFRPVVWFDGPVATLDELYVVPSLRGHGAGSVLLTEVCAQARARGCPEMHIGVDEPDTDARRFYERHGFSNVEPGRDYRMLYYVGPTAPTSSG